MKLSSDRVLVCSFLGIIFLISIALISLPQQRFSELENRYLQKVPELTWDNLLSKKFMEETEQFITDHFPLRPTWIALKSSMEQGRLQQENNGIYKGKDGYLFEKLEAPDFTKLQRYIQAINQFQSKARDQQITFMLVPTSIGMYPERLPWLAPSFSQTELNHYVAKSLTADVQFIDGFDVLLPHADEELFFRTDHHWTTRGAYLAYQAYAHSRGWQPLGTEQFTIETVSNSFLGSLHTRGQFNQVRPDAIEVYTPLHQVPLTMHIVDTKMTYSSLYDQSFLNKKDQYAYFLGGVHALMIITSQLAPEQIELEKLLVIKDSYAHNLIPFLTNHVAELHVLDLRYYNGDISQYMQEQDIHDVLFLFNTVSFVDNPALLKLK